MTQIVVVCIICMVYLKSVVRNLIAHGPTHQSELLSIERRLSVTNLSLENNLLMFQLNAPVVIRAKVKESMKQPTEKPLKILSNY